MYAPPRHVTVGNSPLVLTAGVLYSNTQGAANTFPFPPAPCGSVILDIAVMERLKETLLKWDEKGLTLCLDSARGCSGMGFGGWSAERVAETASPLPPVGRTVWGYWLGVGIWPCFSLSGWETPPKFGTSVHGIWRGWWYFLCKMDEQLLGPQLDRWEWERG